MDSTPLRLPNICPPNLSPPALSDSQVVGVYCRKSRERLGGHWQIFGRRSGVLSILLLIYILWFNFNINNILYCYLGFGDQAKVGLEIYKYFSSTVL